MLKLTIENNDPDILYVTELRIQCALALQAYDHLAGYLEVIGVKNHHSKPSEYSPLEVMSYCIGFLSAVAVLSKILFPAKESAKLRGERLRNRLHIIDLPTIRSRLVRNSYEHIDERIDEKLVEWTKFDSVCDIDISNDPAIASVTLKRLDPASGTIEFLGDKISIQECYLEIRLVEKALTAVQESPPRSPTII